MMRTTLLLFIFPLFMAFAQERPFKDGRYVNEKEMVYAIEIFNQGSEARIYLREDENDRSIDYKLFNSGVIAKVKYKYFIQRLDGPKFSKRRQKELRIVMKDDAIVMLTYPLLNDFYDTFTVYSDEIKYTLQTN